MTKQVDELMRLATDLCAAQMKTSAEYVDAYETLKSALEAALKPGGEPAAVFDEQLGRPVLVEGAPLLAHGQVLYTAAPPAQTPPPGEDFCYCGEEISLQSVSGGAAPEGLYGAVTLRVNGEYVRYVKAQTPPPRLTMEEINALPESKWWPCNMNDKAVRLIRATETLVRKQAGWE